ncbi:MAG: 2-succinyl-5-enolpyruvyl-6-hydroxy-3-cyclohexene-1-carboxylic-acid synthase, partial [Opitutales bacterium]
MPETDPNPFDALGRSTTNAAWGALLMEVLARLGLDTVVTSPGSRSAPLTIAAARNPRLETLSVLDERTAAFVALGLAKRTHKPVALVCTSGSAAANYYPAVVEASMSGTPLLVLTADRPPRLRDCSSGQTIDQIRLYGAYARAFTELALPGSSAGELSYLRQVLVHSVDRSLGPDPGPVHLNVPFCEPLAPDPEATTAVIGVEDLETASTVLTRRVEAVAADGQMDAVALERLASHRHGLIVVGEVNPREGGEAFADGVAELSAKLGWPVLSDALNPLREYAGKFDVLLCQYESYIRSGKEPGAPAAVLQIGPPPTSKAVRAWLQSCRAATFLLADRPVNTDPLHRVATPLRGEATALARALTSRTKDSNWLEAWKALETDAARSMDDRLEKTDALFEGKAAWLLSRELPPETPVFFAGSMSVRYAEFCWRASDRARRIHCNRGANGIDGTLGAALGMAHQAGRPAVLLTGDLAFLHDSAALLASRELKGGLTVFLIQNQGGGIFEHLPVSKMEACFERYFATPQNVDVAQLCRAHGVRHERVEEWKDFVDAARSLPKSGLRVVEVPTDRKADKTALGALLS